MRIFAFILLLALAGLAGAVPPAATLRFEHLSTDDGLAQETVLAIAQDADGFMWFGTQTGLSRYDGYRVTNYRNVVGDAHTVAHNFIRALYVDGHGQLWVGTDGGLDRFEPDTQSFTHFVPNEPYRLGNGNRRVMAIVDDRKGGMWLGTGDGLQHFDPASGKFRTWHRVPGDAASLVDDRVNALALDAAGRLWIGTSGGLDSLEPGSDTFQHYARAAGARSAAVRALLVERDGALWIGTQSGLERWHNAPRGERRVFGPAEGFKPGEVMKLYQGPERAVWIGTREDGLYRWRARAGRFANYSHIPIDSHSLGDNQVSALFSDRVGTFWVGSWYAGASRVDLGSGGFTRIVRQPDRQVTLADNKVHALAADGTGKLWLATNAGLNLYDPATAATVRVYRHDPDHPDSLVATIGTALAREDSGVLWIGSNAGITRFDPATGRFKRRVLVPGDTEANDVRFMTLDRAGMLWIASAGGLHRLDPASGALTTYKRDPGDASTLSDNIVRPILEDRRGRLWVGTFDGLNLLDRATGKFRHFHHDERDPSSLSHDEVHYLLEDSRGNLWVGTASGVNRLVEGRDGKVSFLRYSVRDGLGNDDVAAMLEDRAGRIWVSTSVGLSCLDPATSTWRNYVAADGTIEGAYYDTSALRAADGTLYFGGFNGVTAFNPDAIRDNSVAPRAVITGFQIFNRPVNQVRRESVTGPIEHARTIRLAAQESVFTLEFSALHYAAPQRNRFAYKLEGFDRDWVSADATKRFATYTNLDPGTYVFKVRAANKDGVWSTTPAQLNIVIEPPYWKTWWFRVLGVLLMLGAGYGVVVVRLSSLRRQKELLERQVSARTERIEQQNRLLERQTTELRERERQVSRNTAELADANRALQDNEERLRLAKQRAEDATRQKSEFLANMSHEMRTPLAGVIGMLGFALRDRQLKTNTREQIERGQANAQSLLAIINDLLDFSKIEAGKLTIENIDFALDAAIDHVASLFEEQAAARSVGFAIELASGLPRFVVGDPTRLRQVLVNLLGNAFKFTNDGTITLSVERRPGDQPQGEAGPARLNMIRFSVRDTGIGIAAGALPRLFQKFEQADSTTTRRYGGTGLGLAICRQLVELMGGWISVESVEGVGSTFSFVLPLADGVQPPQPVRVRREAHTHRLTVLCAEDFPTNQIIVRTLLEELGHEVDIAGNGKLALAACARRRYDLVLMDGRMPEMDGATTARLIRAGGEAGATVLDPQVMIVAVTANASDEDRARYLACGMDGFLSKPIDEDALHFQLARAIERQLARGIALEALDPTPQRAAPSTSELDQMFGVFTGPGPLSDTDATHAAGQGAELRQRMRAAFAADLPRRRAQLEEALQRQDRDACAMLLHGLRGSSAYLGEADLTSLCGELEAAADAGDFAALRAALPRLGQMLGALDAAWA